MTTLASAILLVTILAVIVQAVLFAVRYDATERALEIGRLGLWPLVIIWAEATLVLLLVRSGRWGSGLTEILTDGARG